MAGQNTLNQIRQAFAIPDSVVIVTGRRLQPPAAQRPVSSPHFNIDQTSTLDEELYRSNLGTPVYTNIEFLAGEYETNTPGVFKQFGPLRYEAVVISVNQAKVIIKTAIQGRNGKVKEYIGDDDYAITINGIICGPNGHYPIDEVAALKKILDAPISIKVASAHLQNLGIHELVVEDYTLDQKEGGYSYQTFSISCSSDIPQELRLTNV
jgi:hypothetical protein